MDLASQKRGRKTASQHSPSRICRRTALRKRTILACEECRIRKRRCDGAVPACGGCTKRRSQCIYSSEVEAREWNQSMIQSLRHRLEELENAAEIPQRACEGPSFPSSREQRHDQSLPPVEPTYQESSEQLNPGIGKDVQLYHATSTTQDSFVASSLPGNEAELLIDEQGPAPRSPIISYPSPAPTLANQDRHSSQCIRPSSFERLMKPIGQAIDRRSKSATSISPSNHRLSPISNAVPVPLARGSCVCDRILDTLRWNLPARRQADGLIAIYFARHARMFPVLHRLTFLKQYEVLWESRSNPGTGMQTCVGLCKQKSKGKLFPATVNAVFAIASLFSSRCPERNASRALEFFKLAESIDLLDLLNEEVGIEFVQLGLLMAFYLQSTERFSKCWNIAGLALRMAQNMGLHFSIAEARKRGLLACTSTQVECEMRTRVWHACILLETEVSMTFAQPLVIPKGGMTLPEAIDDNLLSDELGKWNTQPKDLPSLMEYYIHALTLYDILGLVLDRQEAKCDIPSDPVSNVRAILSLDSKIIEWHDNLPPYLRYDPSAPDFDPLKGVATLEPVPDTDVVLDFPALMKRLHLRFLCVRQLILRPALDLLFERQQNARPMTNTDQAVMAKLNDSMISNIAAQCILSAVELVEFLASRIQSQSFVCWWYNIHYLHTSGSTILLGRLCTFDDGSISQEALSASWDLCLQHLARYDNMSSIAQKSSQLLQESAKRLLQDEHSQPAPERVACSSINQAAQFSTSNEVLNDFLEGGDALQASHSQEEIDMWNNADLGNGGPNLEDMDAWNNVSFGFPSWAFMPPISQLETFPQQF